MSWLSANICQREDDSAIELPLLLLLLLLLLRLSLLNVLVLLLADDAAAADEEEEDLLEERSLPPPPTPPSPPPVALVTIGEGTRAWHHVDTTTYECKGGCIYTNRRSRWVTCSSGYT